MEGSSPPLLADCLAGSPSDVGPEVRTLDGLLDLAGPLSDGRPGWRVLAPGVVLVHSITGAAPRLALRWLRLPHTPVLAGATGRVAAAVLLTAPPTQSAAVIRLVTRLAACLRDRARLDAALGARSREDLVRALAPGDDPRAEPPPAGPDVLALLASGPAGLGEEEARRRLAACGPNRLERVAGPSLGWRLLEQLWSFFALLLWVAGALAFLAGLPELGWAILAVIVVNGVFSFVQEYRAERAVEALQELLPREVSVIRSERAASRRVTELVPGDVVTLGEGDQVPADGHLLEGDGLRVDQSALSGEPRPRLKRPARPADATGTPLLERADLVFAGTGVVAGRARVVVTATGMDTQIGAIAHLTQQVPDEASPLQREMRQVTRVITLVAVGLGGGFFALGVATGVVPITQGLVFALGVIVANVPEGLLPTLTLALALGVQRMARQRSLLKRLSAVETLGATTVICTDKTGTLTTNRMELRIAWVAGAVPSLDAAGEGATPEVQALLEAAVLASDATGDRGDPTEVALVRGATRAGLDPDAIRAERPLLVSFPFDPFRKRMTLVRATAEGPLACTKGAPRETLALCTRLRWGHEIGPLGEGQRAEIVAVQDRLAAEGLRLLAVATRSLPDASPDTAVEAVERDLTFLGIVALWDPPRPDVAEAIALCRRAGIRVVMITGDYGLTARAIAREIGLPVRRVVTGDEVGRLPTVALRGLLAEDGVLFARTSPAHKLAIVSGLRDLGEVVAVTGDGVNDAPALRAADVGVAMGCRGSTVAKEAAEMVIMDDHFASIVEAVRQGRATYTNIGKFVTYILASNVPELAPFLASVLLGIPLPLTVMQILAVDLGTDLLPALALGAEPPEPGIMDQPPRRRDRRLLATPRLLHAYGFLGVLEAGLSLGAFTWTYWLSGWRPGLPMAGHGELYARATTMTLAGIVAAQVGNVFACRTDRESVFRVGLLSNRLVLAGIIAEIGLLIGLIVIPPFPRVFGLAPLRFAEWGILLLFPPALLLAEELRKAVCRRLPKGTPR
jgi:calcium-translocating P-type ATPase